jgi:pimeloyl-ACP methyl ester carboxylesterase
MPKVKVNDIEMYYEFLGQGKPIVLIRGWGSSSQSWSKPLLDRLSQHYKLIIFDNRGTGRTDKPDIKYSIEMMADDTAGLLDALNIPRVHIVGFSMGGMIAQKFAVKYPEKTDGLVIACSNPNTHITPKPERIVEVMEMMISPPDGMSRRELQKMIMALYSTPEYITEHGEALLNAQLSANVIPTPGYARRRQLDAIKEFSSLEELYLIKSSTLVMHGEKDAWVPFENSKIITDKIPYARLVLFKESGHAFIEQRSEMIKTILDFLNEVDG